MTVEEAHKAIDAEIAKVCREIEALKQVIDGLQRAKDLIEGRN